MTDYRFDAKLLIYGILLLVIGLVGRSTVHWPITSNHPASFIDVLLVIPSILIFAGIIVIGAAMLIWFWIILTLIIGE